MLVKGDPGRSPRKLGVVNNEKGDIGAKGHCGWFLVIDSRFGIYVWTLNLDRNMCEMTRDNVLKLFSTIKKNSDVTYFTSHINMMVSQITGDSMAFQKSVQADNKENIQAQH